MYFVGISQKSVNHFREMAFWQKKVSFVKNSGGVG